MKKLTFVQVIAKDNQGFVRQFMEDDPARVDGLTSILRKIHEYLDDNNVVSIEVRKRMEE
jgi:hypothetical protein